MRRHARRAAGPMFAAALALAWTAPAQAEAPAGPAARPLPDVVAQVRPSIVAVGTLQPTRAPNFEFRGTGFVIGDGLTVVTNAHVLPASLDQDKREAIGIAVPAGEAAVLREARVVRIDHDTDLALLRLEGARLPALPLAEDAYLREGTDVALLGFPLGTVLGLYAAVHRGTVAAVTPLTIPTRRAQQLDARALQRLRAGPLRLYQLDANAFPGNSGSPLFELRGGTVVGIINQVVVRNAKEGALPGPSGITYAVPVRHLHELMATGR